MMQADAGEALRWLELSEQKVGETLKNVNLTKVLLGIVAAARSSVMENGVTEANNKSGKQKKSLLYNLATRMKPQGHHHLPMITGYVMSGGISNDAQLTAAVEYALHHTAEQTMDSKKFEEACGVGVVTSPEELEDRVKLAIKLYEQQITNERYAFNCGRILADVKRSLKWADGSAVKKEVDLQMLLLLGPKTADDLLPPEGKKQAKMATEAAAKGAATGKKAAGEKKDQVRTDNSEAAANSKLSCQQEPEDCSTANSIEELLADRKMLHEVGENWKTDGYVTTPRTMELLAQHYKAVDGKIRTRFPPEPNGILHIGHAKAININFGYARAQGGKCLLRFDDTNPEKEEEKFFLAIEEMVRWLGFEPCQITHSSDNFDQLHEWAVKLIHKDLAYVCHQSVDEMRGFDVSHSPWRNRPVEESLKLFQQMRDGVFEEGEATLRLKLVLEEGKVDPVAYRIKYVPHHRTGDKWCIYPTYDFTHCLCDSIENITHSLCTKEFQSRRSSYYWLCNALDIYCPVQWEYSRLNMCYTVVSKRKILKLIQDGIVSDWDDPRLFTLTALRRRGIPPECINKFVAQLGITVAQSTVEPAMLEAVVRDHLNVSAPRTMVVLEPLRVSIENYAELDFPLQHTVNAPYFPAESWRKECDKFFEISFSPTIYIERTDFIEGEEKGYRRLTKKQGVGLKHIGLVLTYSGEERDKSGKLTGLRVQAEKLENTKKPKAFIHWVSEPVHAEVRLYESLFKHKNPEDEEEVPDGYISDINPHSLTVLSGAMIDKSIASSKELDRYQFERIGYFCVDKDSNAERLVFNRIVLLKEDSGKTI